MDKYIFNESNGCRLRMGANRFPVDGNYLNDYNRKYIQNR